MHWEDLFVELYDNDDRVEIELSKARLLSELAAHGLALGEVSSVEVLGGYRHLE